MVSSLRRFTRDEVATQRLKIIVFYAKYGEKETKTDSKVVIFVRKVREKHPRLGKEKIKPILDEYCKLINVDTISISTIGKESCFTFQPINISKELKPKN